MEVLVPLDLGSVLDLKYLPEEDCLVIVSRLGSVAIFDLNSSMVITDTFLDVCVLFCYI